jgi:predicted amidohydrolase YtcJ
MAPHEAISREEGLKGTLEVGKLADMAILDRDYFTAPAEEIKTVRVEMTVVDGRVVWERG